MEERDTGEHAVPLVRGSHCGPFDQDLYNIYLGPQGCREKRRAHRSSQEIRRGRRNEDAADDRHGE